MMWWLEERWRRDGSAVAGGGSNTLVVEVVESCTLQLNSSRTGSLLLVGSILGKGDGGV